MNPYSKDIYKKGENKSSTLAFLDSARIQETKETRERERERETMMEKIGRNPYWCLAMVEK